MRERERLIIAPIGGGGILHLAKRKEGLSNGGHNGIEQHHSEGTSYGCDGLQREVYGIGRSRNTGYLSAGKRHHYFGIQSSCRLERKSAGGYEAECGYNTADNADRRGLHADTCKAKRCLETVPQDSTAYGIERKGVAV